MTLIIADHIEMIATITLNNDDKRNCLSASLLQELIASLQEIRTHETRVVVIRANKGAQVWSAGLDINELPQPGRDPLF